MHWVRGFDILRVIRIEPNQEFTESCPPCISDRLGYAAGAYGAFCEDFLYGFLYLVIPLYTAYYLVTRWEDLWRWFACSTTGVGLVLFGTQLLLWSGVGT